MYFLSSFYSLFSNFLELLFLPSDMDEGDLEHSEVKWWKGTWTPQIEQKPPAMLPLRGEDPKGWVYGMWAHLCHTRFPPYQAPCYAVLSRPVVSDPLWPCTPARQVSLSMGFSRQEYWGGLPCPSPGDLPDPRIGPKSLMSPALQADSLPLVPPSYVHVAISLNFFEPQFSHL